MSLDQLLQACSQCRSGVAVLCYSMGPNEHASRFNEACSGEPSADLACTRPRRTLPTTTGADTPPWPDFGEQLGLRRSVTQLQR